jgi:Transglutaminase-like superfamily
LLQSLALLPLTSLALWLLGFQRLRATLTRLAPVGHASNRGDVELIRRARETARMVGTAARRGPYHATCLPRSLTLWWLLRSRRIDSDLCIGVRKDKGQFEAHAWVELRGLVLNDGSDVRERFMAFNRAILPAGGNT